MSPLRDRLDRPGSLVGVGSLMRRAQATINTDAAWVSPAGHWLRIERVRRWAWRRVGALRIWLPVRTTIGFRYFADGFEVDQYGNRLAVQPRLSLWTYRGRRDAELRECAEYDRALRARYPSQPEYE